MKKMIRSFRSQNINYNKVIENKLQIIKTTDFCNNLFQGTFF